MFSDPICLGVLPPRRSRVMFKHSNWDFGTDCVGFGFDCTFILLFSTLHAVDETMIHGCFLFLLTFSFPAMTVHGVLASMMLTDTGETMSNGRVV